MSTATSIRHMCTSRKRPRNCLGGRGGVAALLALLMVSSPAFADLSFAQSAPSPTMTQPQATAPAISAPVPARPAPPLATSPEVQTPAGAAARPGATASAAPPNSNQSAARNGLADQTSSPSSFGAEVLDHALKADIVVQAVMIGLIFAALLTWTVWLKKLLELRSARVALRRDIRLLDQARTFVEALQQFRFSKSPVARLVEAAEQEIKLSDTLRADGLKERIALQFERLEVATSRKIARGTGVLATIGSTAPFVGLFGTVWGIMNSFIGIENAHTTNLAVVAPGIAQALLATALGLVAAIPAVMTYNALARATTNYRGLLGDASAQVMRLISRDLDRAKLPLAEAAE